MESKFTWFLCAGSNLLGFGVGIELNCFFVRGVKIDLGVVFGPKIAWFEFMDRN